VIRCLITDGTSEQDETKWIAHLAAWIEEGVELLQIRERELSARKLAALTRKVLLLPNPRGTRILVNDRADVAMACGAHGVHLRDESVAPEFFAEFFAQPGFLVTVACHDFESLLRARGADYALIAPIFSPLSKRDTKPVLGLGVLGSAARISPIPVLALGGITAENAPLCAAAGAAGVAGISYFNGLPNPFAPPFALP
jgi:thiamine-phosphate pyrophosphorylase